MNHSTKLVRRVLAVLIACAGLLALSAGLAVAQDDCYPDGCSEPTNPPPSPDQSCMLSTTAGAPGTSVSATVSNVPADAEVRILFDGSEVARSSNDEQSLGSVGPMFARSSSQAQALSDVTLSFAIPDVPPGNYSVVAVGADFTATCSDAQGNDDFGVLAAGETTGGASDGDGDLALTGFEIAGLLALAVGLVATGWFLVRRARARRLTA